MSSSPVKEKRIAGVPRTLSSVANGVANDPQRRALSRHASGAQVAAGAQCCQTLPGALFVVSSFVSAGATQSEF